MRCNQCRQGKAGGCSWSQKIPRLLFGTKQRVHQERLQYEAGALSIGSDDTCEETLRLLKRATVAALTAVGEKSQLAYEKDVSRVLKNMQKVEGRSRLVSRITLNERTMPMTAQVLVEFVDRWNEENKKFPLMEPDFLFRLCQALQFRILDNQGSTEACLERVSNVMVSYATFD